jgi:hypothetical protein
MADVGHHRPGERAVAQRSVDVGQLPGQLTRRGRHDGDGVLLGHGPCEAAPTTGFAVGGSAPLAHGRQYGRRSHKVDETILQDRRATEALSADRVTADKSTTTISVHRFWWA